MTAERDTGKFWDKSCENLEVSEKAFEDGKSNAAASRYYYAMLLAAKAMFRKRNLPMPKRTKHEGFHKAFIDEIGVNLSDIDSKIKKRFSQARKYRNIADYDPIGLIQEDIDLVREDAKEICQVISDAIKK